MRMKMDVLFEGEPISIEFDYTPGEREITYCGDGSGYPGSAPRVDIISVKGNAAELTLVELEEMVLDEMDVLDAIANDY